MKKHIHLLFLIFNLFATGYLHAQTASQTYASALADEQGGRYINALDKYERIRHFKPDTLQADLFVHLGNCYMFMADYYKALKYYDNALLADIKHERQKEIQLQKIKAEVLAYNLRLAALTLKEIDTINDKDACKEVYFYTGVIHFYLEEYDKAETDWLKLVPDDPAKAKKIDSLFRKNKRINRLKPGMAIALSVILPGAGQIYAGDIKEGLNSFLLNGALFYLGYQTAVVYNIYNAIISVGPWYLRYYEGGIRKAGEIVNSRRAQAHQVIYKKILGVLNK